MHDRHEINIPDRDASQERRREWDITRWMIHLSVVTGVPVITSKNWKNVYARLSIIERLQGHPLLQWEGEEHTTFKPEWILRRIGMRTNAATLTDRQFILRVTEAALTERIQHATMVEAVAVADKFQRDMMLGKEVVS